MKVLIVGGGGREHAIALAIASSPINPVVVLAPGNPGLGFPCEPQLKATDIDALLQFVKEYGVDFTIVGPEAPLAAGIVDKFNAAGKLIFGPTQKAARIETSKIGAKNLMRKEKIPTADFFFAHDFTTAMQELSGFVKDRGYPVVVKADGLCGGKGVVICRDQKEAEAALHSMLKGGKFGEAGTSVVVEEFLIGDEFSAFFLCDGEVARLIGCARDYKAAYPGGPNTGGMGAFSPVPYLTEKILACIQTKIVDRVLSKMQRQGNPYRGLLYVGGILVNGRPMVLEFNARFGDPETQVILARLNSDLLELMLMTTQTGCLKNARIELSDQAAVCSVLASYGYPGETDDGHMVQHDPELAAQFGVELLFAGVSESDGTLVNSGGRVANVRALAPDLDKARTAVYRAIRSEVVNFEGMWFNHDIAKGYTSGI